MHNASPTTWTYMLRSLAHPRLALSRTLLLSQSYSHWRSLSALLGLSCISLRALHLRLFLGLVVVASVVSVAVLLLLRCYCAVLAISFLFCFAFNAFWQQIANHCGISHSLTHTPSPTHTLDQNHLPLSLSPTLSRILWLFVISFSAAAAAEVSNFFDKQRLISNLCIFLSIHSFFANRVIGRPHVFQLRIPLLNFGFRIVPPNVEHTR